MPPYFLPRSLSRSPSCFAPSLELSDGESMGQSASTSKGTSMHATRRVKRNSAAGSSTQAPDSSPSTTTTTTTTSSRYQASELPASKRRRTGQDGSSVPSADQLSDEGPQSRHSRPSSATGLSGGEGGSRTVPIEIEDVEGIVDDDASLAQTLQRQRAEQIKSQAPAPNSEKPLKLSNLQCVICMDSPTDLTATICGHLFCHTCLMEALIAGENRSPIGQAKRAQCPICRKNISRAKKTMKDIIPLLMKKGLQTQPRKSKGVK